MNRKNKESLLLLVVYGMIGQLIVYGVYIYFTKLTLAIIMISFVIYIIFIVLSYVTGMITKKTFKKINPNDKSNIHNF